MKPYHCVDTNPDEWSASHFRLCVHMCTFTYTPHMYTYTDIQSTHMYTDNTHVHRQYTYTHRNTQRYIHA